MAAVQSPFGWENVQQANGSTCIGDVEYYPPALWSLEKVSSFFNYPVPRFQAQLVVIFLVTESLHRVLRRLHLPRFASEILTGIMLGPTVLGQIPGFTNTLFPQEGDILIGVVSKFGYIFFIFLCGVKMDPSLIITAGAGAGSSSAWIIGVLAALIPFAGGMTAFKYISDVGAIRYLTPTFRSVITANNLIAFPVTFILLVDLKIMNSELGRLALTSTLIGDLLSNILATISSNIQLGYPGRKSGYAVLTAAITFSSIGLMIASVQPLSRWIIRQTPEGRPIHRAHVIILSVAALMSAIVADNIGLAHQHGPFLLGLALPDGPPIGSTLVHKLETLTCSWLAPLLVTYCGMRVNLVEIFNLDFLGVIRLLIIACVSMKFCAILFPALVCKMPLKDAVVLAFIMSTQGVVQLTYYSNMYISQAFDGEIFSVATWSVLLTAIGMHLGAKLFYDQSRFYTGYNKRDIQHTSHDVELRVLACSHRADDVLAIKRLLEASFHNKESPLAVYAIHLVELAGRAHPLLIDHQLGQKASAIIGAHAQKAIEVFQAFQQQYMGRISVQLFTSMSLPRFMHHDVCSLAFDKLTSMIILPFHRKWNYRGKLISDNGFIRAMNCNVLDMAPCSVGILMDRHRIKNSEAPRSSTYNVVVVFIGGNDDREALAYGRRMARSPGIHLTVIRFVPWEPMGETQWDGVLDAEILKETRMQGRQEHNILYKEERVKDGADTALQIHALEESFDLIMVGRRHREESPQLSGLNEWTELPELGPIGDILASADISKPVSVLVLQQQIVRSK